MKAYLACVDAAKVSREPFALHEGVYTIGRASASDIVVNDASVSRRHARIVVTDGAVRVTDLGSRNGTFISEARVSRPQQIMLGQVLRCGNVAFRLQDRLLGNGGLALDSELETEDHADSEAARPGAVSLSSAQVDVLKKVLAGYSEKQIAARLCISPHTVHTHMKAIFRSFGVHSRSELLAAFIDGEVFGVK